MTDMQSERGIANQIKILDEKLLAYFFQNAARFKSESFSVHRRLSILK